MCFQFFSIVIVRSGFERRQQPRVFFPRTVLARPHVPDSLNVVLLRVGELAGVGSGAGEAAVVFRLQWFERLLGSVVRRRVRHPEEVVGDGDIVHARQILGPPDEHFQALDLLLIQKPVGVQWQRVGCLICLKGA